MKKNLFSIFSKMRKKDFYLGILVLFITGIFIQSLHWSNKEVFHGVANDTVQIEMLYKRIILLEGEVEKLRKSVSVN
ncbi:hypothetical protein HON22_00185 [Candidatus Peregrinibacteria bacterium]|jgi:hypothetical protein|nr:hypothetical protein [Candidatus Peregrinibacteria bacterium]